MEIIYKNNNTYALKQDKVLIMYFIVQKQQFSFINVQIFVLIAIEGFC